MEISQLNLRGVIRTPSSPSLVVAELPERLDDAPDVVDVRPRHRRHRRVLVPPHRAPRFSVRPALSGFSIYQVHLSL